LACGKFNPYLFQMVLQGLIFFLPGFVLSTALLTVL
jgi:hypothetical protein